MAFAMKSHDTEVPAKARRRRFTAEYKQKILIPLRIGALLRSTGAPSPRIGALLRSTGAPSPRGSRRNGPYRTEDARLKRLSAIFGNCSTLISFQVSAPDATSLRKEMHRSRLLVRPREETGFCTISEFVAHQKQVYREALSDKYLGMSLEERREYREAQKYHHASSMLGALKQGTRVGEMTRARRAEIERVLALLEEGSFEVKALSELFPDYEFREVSFPDVDDFLNLGPGVAFCRVGSADNVCAIQCQKLPDPEPTRRDTVLAELAKRFERTVWGLSPSLRSCLTER